MTSNENEDPLAELETTAKQEISVPPKLYKSDNKVFFDEPSQEKLVPDLANSSSNHDLRKLSNVCQSASDQETSPAINYCIEYARGRPTHLMPPSQLRFKAGGPKKSHCIALHKKGSPYPGNSPQQIRIHSCHPIAAGSERCRKPSRSSEIIYRYHHSLEKDFISKGSFCNHFEDSETDPHYSFFEDQNEFANETHNILPVNGNEPSEFVNCKLYNEDPDAASLENYLNLLWDDIRKQFSVELESVILEVKNRCREEYTAVIEKISSDKKKIEEVVALQKDHIEFQEILLEQKGKISDNLSDTLFKFQDRFLLAQAFSFWKLQFIQRRHLNNLDKIAERFYLEKLKRKAFKTWYELIRRQWKDQMQRHCQTRAEIVCQELVDEYEKKIAVITEELESTRCSKKKCQDQLDDQKDLMKRALLRGVCALNMEAMNAFSSNELFQQIDSVLCSDYLPANEQQDAQKRAVTCESLLIPETDRASTTPQKTRRDEMQNSRRSPCVNSRQSTTPKCDKSQNSSPPVKVVRNTSLPFGSVTIPEKHKPVNKQTVGQYIAARHMKIAASTQTSNYQDASQQTSSISLVSQTKKKRNSR